MFLLFKSEFPNLYGLVDWQGERKRGWFGVSSWQACGCSSIFMSGMHTHLPFTQMEHVCLCLPTAYSSEDAYVCMHARAHQLFPQPDCNPFTAPNLSGKLSNISSHNCDNKLILMSWKLSKGV